MQYKSKMNHTLLSAVLFSAIATSAYANGMPKGVGCCSELTELDKRVKRLEDKAVEGTSKKLFISGQVNRAIMWANDGVQKNTVHGDNDNTSSRIIVSGQAAYNDDLSFGATVGFKATPNSTGAVQVHNAVTSSASESRIGVRQADVTIQSKRYGTLIIGHGTLASYGTHFDTHLSGAYNFMEPYTMGGNLLFRNKAAGGASFALTPAYIFNPGDGANISGRADRIRYDSPSFAGFSMRTSHGYHFRGDIWDVALRYAGEFSGWKFAANTSFTRSDTREADTGNVGVNGIGVRYDNIAASAGALAPFSITGKKDTGIALRFSYANRDYKNVRNKDGRSLRWVLSYKDMFCDMGMTTFEGSFGHYKNMVLVTNPAQVIIGKSWIFGVQQNIDGVGAEVYLSYANQNLKVKNSGQKYRDQDIVLAGARVKF